MGRSPLKLRHCQLGCPTPRLGLSVAKEWTSKSEFEAEFDHTLLEAECTIILEDPDIDDASSKQGHLSALVLPGMR